MNNCDTGCPEQAHTSFERISCYRGIHGIGAQILNDLGVRRIRLLSNHPPKVTAIEAFGLEITETVSV